VNTADVIGIASLVLAFIGLIFAWPTFEGWLKKNRDARKAAQPPTPHEPSASVAQLEQDALRAAAEAEEKIRAKAEEHAAAAIRERELHAAEQEKQREAREKVAEHNGLLDFVKHYGERAHYLTYMAADYQRAMCKGSHTTEFMYEGMPDDLHALEESLPKWMNEVKDVQLHQALAELRIVLKTWPEKQRATSPKLNHVLTGAAARLRSALTAVERCRR
jgi:cell division protein FtsN